MKTLLSETANQLFFDAVMKIDHTSSLLITDHPIEGRKNATDHSRPLPDELVMELAASDVGNGQGHSAQAFQSLKQLQRSGEPISVVTKLFAYKDMLIETLSASEDYTTMNGVRAIASFKEIEVKETATVGVQGRSADEQKTDSSPGGTKQAVSIDNDSPAQNQSIIAGIRESISGLLER